MSNNNSDISREFFARFGELLDQPPEDIPNSFHLRDEEHEACSESCTEAMEDDLFPREQPCSQEDVVLAKYSGLLSQPAEDLSIAGCPDTDPASAAVLPLLMCQPPEILSFERYIDPETGAIPLPDRRSSGKPRVFPPDISGGLGKRQEAMDTAALEAFVVSQAQWMMYDGCLCIYRAPCWHKFGNENEAIKEIRRLLFQHAEIRDSLTISDYRKIYKGLLSNPELESPAHLDTPPYTINCVDGTLNLLTLQPHAHCPEDHFFYCFDLSWRDVVNPPVRGKYFDTFTAQISNGNPAVRQQILEMLSIAMTGTQLKYFFVMLGCSNSGKSQIGRFVQELLGRDNVETVQSIADFGGRFTTGSLYGKLLVSCLDLPNGYLPQTAVGVLKQFCGSDSVKGELKYKQSFTYYKKPLVMLAGNHPIKVQHADREDALFNRMVVIPFADPGIEASQRIPDLYLHFLEEAPYIVHEAALAFQRLADRNWEPTRVSVPAEYAFQEGDHRILAVKAFVKACVFSEPKAEISTADLYQAYDSFAVEYGYPQLDANFFSRKLSEALKESLPEAAPVKKVHGKEIRGYVNIAMR